MRRFSNVLVANRGEIAVRVIGTARALGYRTIAVYSDADVDSPHVRLADTAQRIGPPSVGESYLGIERILQAAREAGAQAVHPGYGFLSENAEFAKACQEQGLVFIGPTPAAIELMGNKARAKERMIEADVPCVPGYQGEQDDDALASAASEIGYPIMIKAAAGGGGRGMRLVHDEAGLSPALASARSEALNAFGDGELILEKAVLRPRHIEVQILADEHGGILHLGERDCSVQRRNQKVIEEAPSPAIDRQTRRAITSAAINVARAIDYRGAGTVEFIADAERNFYFIEMNTRLQVEHPVTEAITGVDLVEQQLRIAQGERITISQDDVALTGHAIEARLYAEDPGKGFLPSTGKIRALHMPRGTGIRVDSGVRERQTVSPHYDPMLAKIIAFGANRAEALNRLRNALIDTVVLGPVTNVAFLKACIDTEAFAAGEATTSLIAEAFPDGFMPEEPSNEVVALAAFILFSDGANRAFEASVTVSKELLGWTSGRNFPLTAELLSGSNTYSATLSFTGGACCVVKIDDRPETKVEALIDGGGGRFIVDGQRKNISYAVDPACGVYVCVDGNTFFFERANPFAAALDDDVSDSIIRSAMHGVIVAVNVRDGDEIRSGDVMIIVEAMKMQNEIRSPINARVERVLKREGDQVNASEILVELQPLEASVEKQV